MATKTSYLSSIYASRIGGGWIVRFSMPGYCRPLERCFADEEKAFQYAMYKDLEYLRALTHGSPYTDDTIQALLLNTHQCNITYQSAVTIIASVYNRLYANCIDHYSNAWNVIARCYSEFLKQYSAIS